MQLIYLLKIKKKEIIWKDKVNNMKKGIIFLLIVIVATIGGYLYFSKGTIKGTDVDVTKEKEKLNDDLQDITKSLGWLVITSGIDNYNSGGKYEPQKNKDLLATTENRQLFIMEKILEKESNYNRFVKVAQDGSADKDPNTIVTDEMTTAYYPANLFNTEYKKYFGEDFDIDNRKVSTLNTAQDKSKDYVYYNNKRAGANGLSVDAMTVNKVKYNKEDALLVADITLTYSSRASSLGYSYSNMTLNYTRDNDNLILKSMFIK